ncbi:MAG: C25 family cysteine peptidase, partial [Candidatus Thermoplasmatota archaeon]|nr:C25 family cysteine peptidase [Candidatus Thermoplasmatota archaeon]
MKIKTKSIQIMILVAIFLLTSTVSMGFTIEDTENPKKMTITDKIHVIEPIVLTTESDNSIISIPKVDTYITIPDAPKIPKIVRTYTFPKATQLQEITCTPSNKELYHLNSPIQKTPSFQSISGNKYLSNQDEIDPYTIEAYPESWYTTRTGSGITTSGDRVIHLTITIYPVRYHPLENTMTFASNFDIQIDYLPPAIKNTTSFETTHDLVIITPDLYVSALNPFVHHKHNYDLNPLVITTTEIYNEFQGRDHQEKIKYLIKHAIETYGTKYVLLIGDITQLPIRKTDAYPWEPYHGLGLLSDLYYADIYDGEGNFSCWDSNNNDIFGEVSFESFPPTPEHFIDDVDLYPDVHIGRIPCSTVDELNIVLSKIITYEKVTSYQNWFKRIILAGGDTFPFLFYRGVPPNVFEGEITNIKVGQQLPGFEQIRLWASEQNLNARTFNQALSEGAGFVSYAGHGFQHGWGTYRPNAIIKGNLILYYTSFLKGLNNEHRLPVIFFDAC